MEERLRGLVHLIAGSDEDDIAFLDLAKSRFQNHMIVTMSADGRLAKRFGVLEQPIRMIKVIEEVEDIVSAEAEDQLIPSVLLEIWIPSIINNHLLDCIFQLIDALQRVRLHYDLNDRVIKLFYVQQFRGHDT